MGARAATPVGRRVQSRRHGNNTGAARLAVEDQLDHRELWSGRWESNPRPKLGKLLYCHCTTPARFGTSSLYPRTSCTVQLQRAWPFLCLKNACAERLRRIAPASGDHTMRRDDSHAHPANVGFAFLRYNLAMSILRRLSRWMGSKDDMTHIVAGNTAPEFSLKSLDQRQYALRSLLERGPVVAAFFKISCPVCQFTFPFLERLHQQYGSGGATFLGISQDDARATKSFASEYGVTFPMVLDDEDYPVSNT